MTDITIPYVKARNNCPSYIGDDLVLFDRFEDVPLTTDPRRMCCLFVALCLEGSAQYSVNTKEYKVHKNDVIIINDSHVIGDYMLSPDCHGVAIMSSSDFFSEIIKEVHDISSLFLFAYSFPVFKLPQEKVSTFMEYFNLIKEKVDESSHLFKTQIVMSLLKAMIYDIGNEIHQYQANTPKRTRAEAIFNQFITLVKDNFRQERRVSWYAKQLCITPKYLSETIKLVSKQSPNEWIDHYVTMEIRVLLKNSTLSIKEIAQQMHFPNQSFLGKYFKEHVGLSPTQYRKE
jgi:YesN/AraC family two-component response regulator